MLSEAEELRSELELIQRQQIVFGLGLPCGYKSFPDSQGEADLLVGRGEHVEPQIANDRPQFQMEILGIEEDC